MRLLTFTRYQKNNRLYTPIEGVIAILNIQIHLPKTRNEKIQLTDKVTILYVNNKVPIKIMLSKGSYSIDQFNQLLTKNQEILTRQWKPPINLKLPTENSRQLYIYSIKSSR